MEATYRRGLAIACFAVAQSLHGSGYIAAFSGGLLFGAIVIGQSIEHFTWAMLGYALLSLTVIRMLPNFLSLTGLVESSAEKLFLGWFGLRGLASIVFAIIVLNKGVPHAKFLATVVVLTVFLSLVARGISANPLAKLIGSNTDAKQD